jgi:hypothetical protein
VRQLFVLAEGQTEEIFVRDVLAPHLHAFEIHAQPVLIATKRVASGGKYRGGVTSWTQVEGDLRRLLGASHAVAVTTMIDLYALPSTWPGLATRPTGPRQVVAHIEDAMASRIDDARFLAHLTLHEFEALLFCGPDICARRAANPSVATRMSADVTSSGEPELVDDGPDTAPSKRLLRVWPTYAKTVDGPTIAAEIGLDRLRNECPHLDRWIAALEAL